VDKEVSVDSEDKEVLGVKEDSVVFVPNLHLADIGARPLKARITAVRTTPSHLRTP